MEVLSARMSLAFKGEDSWKHKKAYDNKHANQAEAKVDQRPERVVNYETVVMRESGHKRLHAGGADGWEGGSGQSSASRSMRRTKLEAISMSNGFCRKPESQQESSDGPETSQDLHPDDSDDSGADERASPEAIETPQKWPIIQIVAPPAWLPEGWTAVLRTRESGSKDKYYVDPVSQRRFRSKTEVNYFLQTGKSYRYKRNLSLLTKPLKEDPVSLPNSVSLRTLPVDIPTNRESVLALPFLSPSAVYGGDHRGALFGEARLSQSPDPRLRMLPPQAELPRKLHNKPGPKPKFKTFAADSGRSPRVSVPKRSTVDEKEALECSQGAESKGKLILKLKRKTAELDEGQRNGKKPRPFEVVGVTPILRGTSRSSTSDEEERLPKNQSGVDHAVECSSWAPVPHSLVPSTHLSRRPITKAPRPSWQYQPHPCAVIRPQYGGSNGQGQVLEKNCAYATLVTAETENPKALALKRESPAEQLQKLGRKLCQQAVDLLCSEYGQSTSLKQLSFGLHPFNNSSLRASRSHQWNGGSSTHFNSVFSPAFNSGFHTPLYQQHQPVKRMRGSLPKERCTVPLQFTLVPRTR